jgi:hypothetical protein
VDREQGTLTTVGHAAVVLDHLFICVAIDAPESAALTRIGLIEGTPNTHPGQGTACRRFFFRNMYLELIWVHDRDEARSHAASKLELWSAGPDATAGHPHSAWSCDRRMVIAAGCRHFARGRTARRTSRLG